MNDDRGLREHVDRLESEAWPRDQFAVGLYEDLERRRRAAMSPWRRLRLVAAPLAAAAVIGGVVLAIGVSSARPDVAASPSPSGVAVASPTPSPNPTSAPPVETSPTATAAASPSGGATAPQLAALSRGRVFRVSADELRVRRAAGTDAESIASYADGDIVVIQSGPSVVDGYMWYEVAGGGVVGWIAAYGPGNEPWISPMRPEDPVDAIIELRVQGHVVPDIYIPDAVVLTDGRVIWFEPSEEGTGDDDLLWERQLSAEGLAALARRVFESGLLGSDAFYRPEPILVPGREHPGRGISTYNFTTTRVGQTIAVQSAIPDFDPEYWRTPDEMLLLDDVAQLLLDPEQGLAADDWGGEARPYRPPAFLFMTVQHSDSPLYGDEGESQVDVADVAWPLPQSVEEFGEPYDRSGEPDYTKRCGVVDADTAQQIHAALREAGQALAGPLEQPRVQTTLRWDAERGEFTVELAAVLEPREPSCDNGMLPTY